MTPTAALIVWDTLNTVQADLAQHAPNRSALYHKGGVAVIGSQQFWLASE
jgi:hypothetical protein